MQIKNYTSACYYKLSWEESERKTPGDDPDATVLMNRSMNNQDLDSSHLYLKSSFRSPGT